MSDSILLTKENLEQLKEKLAELLIEKPQVIARIDLARSHGDLKENADYHAARERLGFLEGQLALIQDKIARAQVIDTSHMATDKVLMGSKVKVEDSYGDTECFHVVSDMDAGTTDEKVSINSPIGKALIGKKVGDMVAIKIPRGTLNYKILEISF
ncbi:MAG TPA: transcription elongation factor GreA [Chitinispirillaceae bacterium]|nr:transcription elongation factor GreA [Chitinispirillaceae bacterium]